MGGQRANEIEDDSRNNRGDFCDIEHVGTAECRSAASGAAQVAVPALP
jgi:hypothetical protein